MPGLGELHHRYPILKFFRASTRKHPSMANDSYAVFCTLFPKDHTQHEEKEMQVIVF